MAPLGIPVLTFASALTDHLADIRNGDAGAGIYLSAISLVLVASLGSWMATSVTRQLLRYRRRLQLSQQRLRGIVNSAMDAVVTTDSSGIILLFNQSAEKIFACDVENSLGKPLGNFIQWEQFPWNKHEIEHEKPWEDRNYSVVPVEFTGKRSNGEKFPIEATYSRVEVKGEILHTLIMRDISERYRNEEEARKRTSIIKTITENATLSLFMVDTDNRCIFMNPSAEKMLGYPLEEVRHRSILDFLSKGNSEDIPSTASNQGISTALSVKKEMAGEDMLQRKDGTSFPVAFTAGLISEGSATVGTVLEIQDITERKKTETMLRERGERLQAAISASDTGTFRWTFGSDYLEADGNLERLFGLPQGKNIRPFRDFLDNVHQSDKPKLVDALDQCAKRGVDISIEFRVVLPDGKIRWLADKGKTFFDRDGNPIYMTGACVDITERKSVEEQLRVARRESEENLAQLEAVVRSMSEGLIIADPKGELLFMNPSALSMFEQNGASRSNRRLNQFDRYLELTDYHSRILPMEKWPLTRAERGESFSDYEVGIRHTRTGRKWIGSFTGNPVVDKAGKTILAIVMVRDITREKATQEALRRQSQLTKTITDNASVGLLLLDEKGRPTFMNPAAVNMLGYTLKEARATALDQLVKLQINPGVGIGNPQIGIMKALSSGVRLKDFEDTFLTKDGGLVQVLCSLEPLVQGGKTIGAVLEISNITARKKAEDALRESEGKLRQSQKMEAIGQLAGGIAHDFNNLLTAINGYSELTLAMIDRSNPLYGNISEIRRAGERAAALTRQLLAYSRKQIVLPQTLNLNQVIATIHSMLRRLIPENIRIVHKLDRSLGLIRIDPNQLEQVILNLALNARDAMPQGGSLTFTTFRRHLDERISVDGFDLEPGAFTILEVADTGMGMPDEIRSKVFEPFFTTKEVGKGTGLGLSSVYGIIKQSGGAITLRSRQGEGTTFELYFPQVIDSIVTEKEKATQKPKISPSQGEIILLVEDEDSVRNFTRRTLEKQGYRILEARNGKEALAIIKKNDAAIDILVSDVVMPGLNGPELAKQVLAGQPDIKILFMSGYTDEPILAEVVTSTSGFLQKPFSPSQLTQKVHDLLHVPKGKLGRTI